MEHTNPITVDALVRLATRLRTEGRTTVTFTEVAAFIGCHHPSVRNWLMGRLSRSNLVALRKALHLSEVRISRTKAGWSIDLVGDTSTLTTPG